MSLPSSPIPFEQERVVFNDATKLSKPLSSAKLRASLENEKFDEYPTPNPSSSTGFLGSSSPIHEEAVDFSDSDVEFVNVINENESTADGPKLGSFVQPAYTTYRVSKPSFVKKAKVKKIVISSKKKTKVIELPNDGTEITFGRSSTCDVIVNDTVNLASRKHASVRFDPSDNTMIFQCFGVNSMEVYVPFKVDVKRLGGADRYELIPKHMAVYNQLKDKGYEKLLGMGLTKFSRSLQHANGGVRILVLNNEALKVPKCRVVLDIRGASCNIKVAEAVEDELTDEETSSQSKAVLYKVGDDLNASEKSNEKEKVLKGKETDMEKEAVDERKSSIQARLPDKLLERPTEICKKVEEAASDVTFESSEQSKTPLKQISESALNTISLQKIKGIISPSVTKKRGRNSKYQAAEEIAKKKPKSLLYDYQDPKTLIDAVNKDEAKKQKMLLKIEELSDIKKVLINHLAFSRVASTPLSSLKIVSKQLERLDKKTMRLVLSDIACVGIIYRKGKDAAGKPLDEEYYYDIDKDDDEERVQLVNSVKGGSSLRSCRKTHKQYYWKRPPPLPRY